METAKLDVKTVPHHQQIRFARMAAGKTQNEIACKAKINRSKLSLYESGLLELSPAELARLASAIGKPRIDRVIDNIRKMQAQEDIEKPVDQRRALRQLLNLSQHAVAKAIGVPQSRLSEWERGRLEITPEQQEKWNQVLEERVKEDPWLMFGVERLVVRHTFELSNYWKKAIEDVINQTLDAQNKLLDELPTLSDELQRQRSADVLALTAPIYQLGEKYVAKIKDANIEVKSKVKEKAEEKIGGKENAS